MGDLIMMVFYQIFFSKIRDFGHLLVICPCLTRTKSDLFSKPNSTHLHHRQKQTKSQLCHGLWSSHTLLTNRHHHLLHWTAGHCRLRTLAWDVRHRLTDHQKDNFRSISKLSRGQISIHQTSSVGCRSSRILAAIFLQTRCSWKSRKKTYCIDGACR